MSILIIGFSGCAGPNPNIGERTADVAWHQGDTQSAHGIIKKKAIVGYPWAQLRLGVMYELGVSVEKNIPEAIKWYKLAAAQKSDTKWADGYIIGAIGEQGFFGQNSDARIAQYQLANIYLTGNGVEKNIKQAYRYIAPVVKETKGSPIFYCCEFSGGQWIPAEKIEKTYKQTISQLTKDEVSTLDIELR
ncbi:tetratricopeptide repeat protein [Sulfurimonas sp.]|uniref:tetratricopeptide repeat protein n=1 Tax=Sulfurimonas sp. TaxID=2022749 RepID=UPI0025D709C7|nr:tetratricopeptide repeat protein [Sulfurimonas sp.]MBT5933808.1 sel1 repeat family protein [Sulfurimonas sp.]